MYFVKTPWYLKSVYPSLVWDLPKPDSVYLTFDDGPVPGVTDTILDILNNFQIKANFFCIGDNVKKHPELFQRILAEGHIVGNHTQHHLNGWKTENQIYFDDIAACEELVHAEFFRPPYGRIGFHQIQELKKKYTIVMWDVLSGDFDLEIDAQQCVNNVIDNTVAGSIIVFHDSEKAKERVLPALPQVIEILKARGYQFDVVSRKVHDEPAPAL